jgi:RNA polymerase sigma factor (sigma-70 family)
MTATATKEIGNDVDLVTASRQGNREAFGQIVRRYQGLISGLIYSACGDLSASEDIAQETFLAAWKSLSGLRQPQKLAAWLCQIARHRMLDQHREDVRQNARLARSITQFDAAGAASPDEEAMSAEEREVLWRSLAEIAEPYRETLILYYRQDQSAEEVAAALEISEETVRQRLARGRQMLREQVTAMLERNLVRSAPRPQFASMVVAALPALMMQSATAATAGGIAKATTAAKGVSLISLLGMWLGPIIGVAGGIFGTAQSIRSTQTPRERRFVIRFSIMVWVYVILAMAVLFGVQHVSQTHHWSVKTRIIAQCSFWLIYGATLVALVLKWKVRHQALRREEGLPSVPAACGMVSPMARVVSLAGAIVGSLSWMLALAIPAGDMIGTAIVVFVTIALIAWAWLGIRPKSALSIRRLYLQHVVALVIFSFIMINWRLHSWLVGTTGKDIEKIRQSVPLWGANLLLLVLFMAILSTMWVTMPGRGDRKSSAG